MTGRDHDAAVEVVHSGDVSHRRRSGNVQQVGICAGSGQTCDQAVLEHIRATAGVLANDDAGGVGISIALT